MTDRECQRRLATLWLAVGIPLLVLLGVQDLRNVFGEQSSGAWSWYGAAVVPTLTVIVGTVINQARTQAVPVTIDRFAYRLAMGLSGVYLFLVVGTLVYVGIAGVTAEMTPLQVLNRSTAYLTPVQGFVGLAIGAFFGSRGH